MPGPILDDVMVPEGPTDPTQFLQSSDPQGPIGVTVPTPPLATTTAQPVVTDGPTMTNAPSLLEQVTVPFIGSVPREATQLDSIPVKDQLGRIGNVRFDDLEQAQADGWVPASPEEARDWDEQGDEVSVIDEGGNVGQVLKAALDQALAEGFRLANRQERDEWDARNPTVFVKDVDGRVDATTRENAQALYAQGYVRADDEDIAREYGDADSQVVAGVEGVLQGATAHLYRPIAQAAGGDAMLAEIDQRERNNRVTHTIGEGVGIIGGSLVSRGLSAGQLVRNAATRMAAGQTGARAVMTRIAGNTLAGALETGAYSAVARTGDALTGDHELDAESILLGAGQDAVLGGALGLGLSSTGEAVRAAFGFGKRQLASIMAHRTLPEAIDAIADEQAFKAVIGGSNKQAARAVKKRLGEDGPRRLGRWLNERNVELSGDAAENVERLAVEEAKAGAQLRGLVDQLDAVGVRPDTRLIADAIDSELAKYAGKAEKKALLKQVRSKLRDTMDDLRKSPGEAVGPSGTIDSFRRVWEARQNIDNLINHDASKVKDLNGVLKDVRRVMEDSFTTMADDLATKVPEGTFGPGVWKDAFTRAKQDFQFARMLRDAAKNASAGQAGNGAIGLKSAIYGMAGADIAGDIIAGQAVGVVKGAMGSVIGGPVAGLASAFLAQKVATNAPSMLANSARGVGRLLKAPPDPTRTITKAFSSTDRAITSAVKVAEETLLRGIGAASVAGADDRTDEKPPSDAKVAKVLEQAQQVVERDGEAEDALDDMADVVADGYGLGIADALEVSVRRRAEFIVSKASLPTRKLLRVISAMESPGSAMKRIAQGRGTEEDVQVIKELYPRAFRVLGERITRLVSESEDRLDRRVVARLSRQLGVTLGDKDPSMGVWMRSIAKAPSSGPGPQGKRPNSRGPSVDMSRSLMSPSQQAART
jgi:hypothetical protein